MAPSELHDVLQRAAVTAQLTWASLAGSCDRIDELERELASRPTQDAYEAACKALHHWREEAARLAKLAGVEPRQMNR